MGFKAAYDTIDRLQLYSAIIEFGIPRELEQLIKMSVRIDECKVRVQKELSETLKINRGLPQGDAISCTLLNQVLE